MAGGKGSSEFSLVLTSQWQAVIVFRVLAFVYVAWNAWARIGAMIRPAAAMAVLAVLGLWSALQTLRPRRTLPIHLAELALAAAAVLATPYVDTRDVIHSGVTTLPGVWQSVPVAALGIILGWRGGVVAGALLTAVGVHALGRVDAEPLSNGVLLILVGGTVGYAADAARSEQRKVREVMRRQAEADERTRLALLVHDGVLQALAYIHRRGQELGSEAAELGDLAAEQERRLRALLDGRGPESARAAASRPDDPVDLCAVLEAAERHGATVVTPGEPVPIAADRGSEIAAAVSSALDNVEQHAGPTARAWVLVEDVGDAVVVTVRDDGIGTSQAALDDARARGRLGVAAAITGRIEDLGGRVVYEFGPGTTLEMTVPKRKGVRR